MRLEHLDTPSLLVDLDILESNLRRAQSYCDQHNLSLRPHTKTHKSVCLARWQEKLGAKGITVAKLGEAEVMAEGGLRDILIAYPLVGEAKYERLAALIPNCRITVAVDSWEAALAAAAAARLAGGTVGVLVEADTGLRRVGITAPEAVAELCARVSELKGVEWCGLQTYQGHVLGDAEARSRGLAEEQARLERLLEALDGRGLKPPTVSGGSTPNLFEAHRLPQLTEIRPGTYVYNDCFQVALGNTDWSQCALRVLVTIVSTSVEGRMVVDGGSKTFASDRVPDSPDFGHVMEDPLLRFPSVYEEHGVLDRAASERRYAVGERLTIVPNHVCTCVNLHDGFWVHRGGEVKDWWPVDARGRVR
ncbi:MAG TPA: alanine racemase [Armatimonadota bacterium]